MKDPGASRVPLPFGLMGMLALIVVIERGFGAHSLELTSDQARLEWRAAARAVSAPEARRAEVLCFGDSLVKRGIYPRIVEAAIRRPVYNLALPAGLPPASYLLLRRSLEAGARPRAIVLDAYAMILPCRPRKIREYWPELVSGRELVDLSCVARDLDLFTVTVLHRAMSSLKHRDAIRAATLRSLRGEDVSTMAALLNRGMLRNLEVNRGVLVSPPVRPPISRDNGSAGECEKRTPQKAPAAPPWLSSPVNVVYLDRFLDLAARRAIPVFWLIPPVGPDHQAAMERGGIDERYTAFLEEIQERHPNLVVVDGRRAGYPSGVFTDGAHLDRSGATALSNAVAFVLSPHLAGVAPRFASRWVDLPGYRTPSIDVPLEDLGQSVLASKTRTGAARRF